MITLTSAIQSLRKELAAAARQAAVEDEGVRMVVEDAEVELQVMLTKELKANTEVNVWVVKVGGSGGATSADTHVVRLRLKPMTADGRPLEVSSRDNLPEPSSPRP